MTHPPPQSPPEERFDFSVVCPVEKSMLRVLRRFVTTIAAEHGFDEDDVAKIEISVDEACSNIARHAYPHAERAVGKIELKLRLEEEGLIVRVQDWGRGGELRGADDIEDYRRLDRPHYGGLGLLIIHQFMDDVQIRTTPGQGTTVTMRKMLRGAPAREAVEDRSQA